jgi:APA family basic amino acid/polyamine antiporter
VWVLIVITKPDGRYLGLAWIAFGLLMYFFYRRRQKISATGQLAIHRVKVPDYQPMSIKTILVPTRGGVQTETIQMACEIAQLHHAKLTAMHVIDVPYSMPMDTDMSAREAVAETILKSVEAIAREKGISVSLRLVRSRSVPHTIIETARKEKFDLLVLGTIKSSSEAKHKGLGAMTEKILREAPCRVWVCASDNAGKKASSNRLLSVE